MADKLSNLLEKRLNEKLLANKDAESEYIEIEADSRLSGILESLAYDLPILTDFWVSRWIKDKDVEFLRGYITALNHLSGVFDSPNKTITIRTKKRINKI